MIKLLANNWLIDDVDTIFLDKDGTFIDLHFFWGKMTELRCLEIIKHFNLSITVFADLCKCLGYDINSQKMQNDGITALYSRSKIIEIFKQDLLAFGVSVSETELAKLFDDVSSKFYLNMFDYTKPIYSAIDFIMKAKKLNVKTAIVTSDSLESTYKTIKMFNWEGLFDCCFGRESSNETKESGALSRLALSKLGANPETTVMIGDAPMDYFCAKNSGIAKTILVATGQMSIVELSDYSSYVVNTLSDVDILIK